MRKHSLFSLAFSFRYASLQKNHAQGVLTQDRVFRYLIKKAKRTEWGKKYNYQNIKSYADFRETVPLNDYNSLLPYIERDLQGEDFLLWPDKIKYYSKSSGTTSNKSKYIPVSNEALKNNHYLGGRSLFACYFHHFPNSNIFLGRNFALGGSRQDDILGTNKYIADVSVILMKNLPWWASLFRSPRFSIASMNEWEEKLDAITNIIKHQNIVSISGVPSWNLVLLKKILKDSHKSNIHEIWPNLELFVHGGTSMAPYRDQFKELLPEKKMNYLEAYNASEGFFAFQDDLKSSDLLLFLNGGIFYEFITLKSLFSNHPQAISLKEVELKKNYALVISTNSGLWRYIIGDTVRFTQLNPYRIIISGRTKSFINACGEELVVENADQAVAATAAKCGVKVKEYTAAPKFNKTDAVACHQWLVEFEGKVPNLENFKIILDTELKLRNSDYEAKRYKSLNLSEPVIIQAKKGLFYNWLKNKSRLGGQSKVPRLSNQRELIEELLEQNRRN